MVVLGAFTARGRAKGVPRRAAVAADRAGRRGRRRRSGSSSRSGIFEADARSLVPVGGMVIGNAMAAAGVALNRLGDEMRSLGGARSRRRCRSARPSTPGGRADGAAQRCARA